MNTLALLKRSLPFVAVCAALSIGACTQAVKPAEPDPKPSPEATFLGTVWHFTEGWYERDEHVGEILVTLTFTKSRFILHRRAALDEEFHDSGIEPWEHAENGSWGSVTETTIVKSYFEWNDEEDRAESEPTDVARGYAFYGEELLLQTWHDERPDNNFERMARVANIDPRGSWYFHGHEDGHDFTVTHTFAADGTFRRFFESPGAGTFHEILGTYELDLDEQFANVVIQETRNMDGVVNHPAMAEGQRLRVAWAATDASDRIVISQFWEELMWDETLGERVEHTDHQRWGGYGVVAHKVME